MSNIFINIRGFGRLETETVFLSKEGNKSKVVTDILQRYANIINENIKKGKTLKEKKLWFRKLVYKRDRYSNSPLEEQLFMAKMVDKFLQEFQHSRNYDLIDYDSKYYYKNEIELDINVPSLKIIDRSDKWKEMTDEEEKKELKDRVNKQLVKLKKEMPKGWCFINSVDSSIIVGNEFEEKKAFNCYFDSSKKFNLRMDYYAMTMIDDNKLYEQIKQAVQVIEEKSRGHWIKDKAKQLYKETFGMTWK